VGVSGLGWGSDAERRRQFDCVLVDVVGADVYRQGSWCRRNKVGAVVSGVIELALRGLGEDGQRG
jgi:hypothetical protein